MEPRARERTISTLHRTIAYVAITDKISKGNYVSIASTSAVVDPRSRGLIWNCIQRSTWKEEVEEGDEQATLEVQAEQEMLEPRENGTRVL